MKKIFYLISCLALAAGFAVGCADLPAPFETEIPERPITAPIKRVYAKVNQEIFEGVIDNSTRTVSIQLTDPKMDVSAIEVHMELISRAVPAEGCFEEAILNLTEPYSFYVNNLETDLLYTITVALPTFAKIDRSKCALINCTGDGAWYSNSASNHGAELFDGELCQGFKMYTYPSGNYKYFGWASNSDTPWFTFDVGESCQLYQIFISPYYGWIAYDPAVFEIWAYTKAGEVPSTTPSNWRESGDWTKILEGDVTERLQEAWKVESKETGYEAGGEKDPCKQGATVVISEHMPEGLNSVPSARYYRWVVVKSQAGYWGPDALKFTGNGVGTDTSLRMTSLCMSELELYKYQF